MELEYAPYNEQTAHELASFAQNPSNSLPPTLDRLLVETSRHGLLCYPWEHLRECLCAKLGDLLDMRQAREERSSIDGGFEIRRDDLINRLKQFESAPFTLQRICEMLTDQGAKQYRSSEKFMFAFEKLVSVTSTQDVMSPADFNSEINELSQTMKRLLEKPVPFEGQSNGSLRNSMAFSALTAQLDDNAPFASTPPVDPMIIDS